MAKVEYENVIYDSQEELDFKHWLDEAFEAGLITGYSKCKKGRDSIELIPKQLLDDKFCFHPIRYTPDDYVTGVKPGLFDKHIMGTNVVDVKGKHSKHNDEKQFQLIRKMMLYFHGIYVHKVVPEELFQKTWVPELCRYTKVKGDIQKKYLKTPTIKQYLKIKG